MQPFMVSCFFCGGRFQFGPHRYAGRHITSWKIDICDACDAGNHDGLNPTWTGKIQQHLRAVEAPEPALTPAGLIIIPPRGS